MLMKDKDFTSSWLVEYLPDNDKEKLNKENKKLFPGLNLNLQEVDIMKK